MWNSIELVNQIWVNFFIVDFFTHEECRKENSISLNSACSTNILISYGEITSCVFRDILSVLFERTAPSILSLSLTVYRKEFQIVSILVGNSLSEFLQYAQYLSLCFHMRFKLDPSDSKLLQGCFLYAFMAQVPKSQYMF